MPFCMTDRAGPVMRRTTGSGSVWLCTPAAASTPTMTLATAIEFGGLYDRVKLEAFHDYCRRERMGYELW